MRSPFDALARLRALEARGAVRALAEALRAEAVAAAAADAAGASAARVRREADAALRWAGPATGERLAAASHLAARRRSEEATRAGEAAAATGAALAAAQRRQQAALRHRTARDGQRAVEELAGRWRAERRRARERRLED